MYINYLDLFSIQIESDASKLVSFLKQEYKYECSKEQKNKALVHLIIEEDSRKESDYVVREPVSYDNKGVYIFDKQNKKLRINFSSLGDKSSEINCDPNFHPPFFAILIDYLASVYALSKKQILIHASCFSYKGTNILCPAWRNVGKTNSLLTFMRDGAHYLSDDWCLVDELGCATSIPKAVCLFDYNLSSFPQIASRIETSLLPLIQFLALTETGKMEVNELVDADIRKNLIRRISPEDLFPDKVLHQSEKIDVVFNLVKNSINPSERVISSNLKSEILIRRMYEVLRLEQSPFRLAYSVHKARTGEENKYLKEEKEIFFDVASKAFRDMDIFELLVSDQKKSNDVKTEILNRLGIV